MRVFFWVLQGLLALHTFIGAVWKFSNPATTVPELSTIPHGAWLALGVIELLCVVGLILPAFNRRAAILAPIAAGCVAAEMLLFVGVSLYAESLDPGHVAYWLVVAAVCAGVVYGRLVKAPLVPRTV